MIEAPTPVERWSSSLFCILVCIGALFSILFAPLALGAAVYAPGVSFGIRIFCGMVGVGMLILTMLVLRQTVRSVHFAPTCLQVHTMLGSVAVPYDAVRSLTFIRYSRRSLRLAALDVRGARNRRLCPRLRNHEECIEMFAERLHARTGAPIRDNDGPSLVQNRPPS